MLAGYHARRLPLDPDEVRAAFGDGAGPFTLDLLPCDQGDHVTVTLVGPGGVRTLEQVEVSVGSTR